MVSMFLFIGIAVSVAAVVLKLSKNRFFVFVKPLPALSMALLLVLTMMHGDSRLVLLIVLGLVLGALGDVLLEFEDLFVPGLVSFLLGHIMYAVFLFLIGHHFYPITLVMVIVSLVYAFFFFKHLPEKNAALRLPVVAYMATITVMCVFAQNADLGFSDKKSFFTAGALLFYLSDATLAWHLLVKKVKFADFSILLAYYSAQMVLAFQTFLWIQ